MASHYNPAVDKCLTVIKLVRTTILGPLLLALTSLLLGRCMQGDNA